MAMTAITRYSADDPVIFSDMNKTLDEIEARDNDLEEQINVLTAKTTINLGAGTGYTIVSQNCYIQNGKTYINALFKKTDSTAFPIGALYIGTSNLLPVGRFAGSCIGYSNISDSGAPSSRITNSLNISMLDKNVTVLNTVSNLMALDVTIICS